MNTNDTNKGALCSATSVKVHPFIYIHKYFSTKYGNGRNTNIQNTTPSSEENAFNLLDNCIFLSDSERIIKALNSKDTRNNICFHYEGFKKDSKFDFYLITEASTKKRNDLLIKWCASNDVTFCDPAQLQRMQTGNPNIKTELLKCFKDNLLESLLFLVGTNGRIRGCEDDMRMMGVPHCMNVYFSQYLGQEDKNKFGVSPKLQIKDAIYNYKKLIIKSNAGTGKGYVMKELSNALDSLGFRCIIYVFPTNSITDQQYEDFDKFYEGKEGLLRLDARFKAKDYDEFLIDNGRIILATFDSLHKLEILDTVDPIIDESVLVVDEYHSLISDIDFRSKEGFNYVLSAMSRAKYSILCSATPELIFCESDKLNRHFGYKLINGIESVTNEITVKALEYDSKEGQKSIVTYVQENYAHIEGTALFKLDKKESLRTIINGLDRLGLNVGGFWSGDNEEHKTKNDNYNSISKTGLLSTPLDWLVFTTLLEAGVSLKFLCSVLVVADKTNATRLIQLSTRARYNAKTGVNSKLDVIVCKSSASKENVKGYQVGSYTERFASECKVWQKYKNNTISGVDKVRTISDQQDIELILGDENEAEISLLGVLHLINKDLDSISLDETLLRASRMDGRFIIGDKATSDHGELEQIKEEHLISKENRELREVKAIEAVKDDFRTLCDLIAFNSKDVDKKDKIREVLGIVTPDKERALDFAAKHPTVLGCKFVNKIITTTIDLKAAMNAIKKPLSNEKAVELVLTSDTKDIKSIVSTLNHKIRKSNVSKNTASTVDSLEYYKVKSIKAVISKLLKNMKRGTVAEHQLVTYYQKHINKALLKVETKTGAMKLKPISKNKCMCILNDLYFVEKVVSKACKKKVTKIKILELRKVQSALNMLQ